VLALQLALVGCTCGDKPLMPTNQCVGVAGAQEGKPNACASSDECGDHFSCKDVKDKAGVQCCVFVDRSCATEADCCPGQTCPADRKKCFDKSISCTKDADCGDRGDRFCETYTDTYGSSNRCRFHTCGALGECPEGQACFQGECMADLPCNGTCESGKACVPSIDRCQDYAQPTGRDMAACPMTCAPGYIGTFKDPRNIWDSCELSSVKCVCAELPGLRSNDLGRFSAIAADPGKALYVSAYDGQYGDLVVLKHGLDGKRVATEYVDGVPSATVKYGPSGARGGVVEPGPDVGRYTDLAVAADGRVWVSYYDVTNGDLKVAVRGVDGKWAKHTVDGASGDVGLYSSLALDSTGHPAVSYFQRGADTGFDVTQCPAPQPSGALKYVTALKFARATTTSPASASDWVVKTVSCLDRPPPPCDACGTGVCADTGSGPACFATATTCTSCDPNNQVCVTSGATATCAKKASPTELNDVPIGVGLFSSLAFKGDEAIIAFTRRNAPTVAKGAPKAELLGVSVSAQNVPAAVVVLDATGDTGYFPDVKVEPGTSSLGIGYHDFTSKSFKFYYAGQLRTGVTPEVIDTGVDAAVAGNQSFVGTDSAIVFTGSGKALAVYQDPTKGDLKLARRGATWVVDTSVATEGAVGFFADAVLSDGKVYASHARLRARIILGEPRVDNTVKVELLTP
jgi:hypothetical protein